MLYLVITLCLLSWVSADYCTEKYDCSGAVCERQVCCAGYTGDQCSIDVDECADGSSGCEQICVNTQGSFRCECRTGYTINTDGKTCNDDIVAYESELERTLDALIKRSRHGHRGSKKSKDSDDHSSPGSKSKDSPKKSKGPGKKSSKDSDDDSSDKSDHSHKSKSKHESSSSDSSSSDSSSSGKSKHPGHSKSSDSRDTASKGSGKSHTSKDSSSKESAKTSGSKEISKESPETVDEQTDESTDTTDDGSNDNNNECPSAGEVGCPESCTEEQWGDMMPSAGTGCSKYCHCAPLMTHPDGRKEFYWQEMPCAPGTLWNDELKTCDHEHNVECPCEGDTSKSGCPDSCTQEQWGHFMVSAGTGCSKYCHCTPLETHPDGSVDFYWQEMPCGTGTLWNNNLKTCDHAHNVECDGSGGDGDGGADNNGDTDGGATGGGSTNGGSSFQTGTSSGCPESCTEEQWGDMMPSAGTGCSKYCHCAPLRTHADGRKEFYWQEMPCGEGTLWNDELKTCDHAHNVECGAVPSPQGCPDSCTRPEWGNYMVSAGTGCSKYCHCTPLETHADGSTDFYWQEMPCGTGTLWNNNLKTCDHAHNVECDGSGGDGDGGANNNGGTDGGATGGGSTNGGSIFKPGTSSGCPESCTEEQWGDMMPSAGTGCSKYCHCAPLMTHADGRKEFYWQEMPCGKGTLWNDELKTCDHEHNVECGAVPSPQGCPDSCTIKQWGHFMVSAGTGCSKYCHCTPLETHADGSYDFYWQEMPCGEGTLWDDDLKTCNHAYAVQCGKPVEELAERAEHILERILHASARSRSSDSSSRSSDSSSSDSSSSDSDSSSASSDKESDGDERKSDGDTGDNTDGGSEGGDSGSNGCPESCTEEQWGDMMPSAGTGCSKYCHCAPLMTHADGRKEFYWQEMPCGPGTLWNDELKTCDHAHNVECGAVPSPTGCPDSCTIKQWGHFMVSAGTGCSKYCHCTPLETHADGSYDFYWQEMPCGEGTLWNDDLKTCDHAHNVECGAEAVQERFSKGESISPRVGCPGFCKKSERDDFMVSRGTGCTKYCYCTPWKINADGSAEYYWQEMPCGPGTVWHQEKRLCDFGYRVKCLD